LASQLVQGGDFENDVDQITELRPNGVPYRFATSHDLVAMSRSTQMVQEWLVPGASTLRDDPHLAAGASALDSIGSVSAWIFTQTDFSYRPNFEPSAPAAITSPFSAAGFRAAAVISRSTPAGLCAG
jgi:hypothetical protein